MTKLSNEVWKLIEADPVVKSALSKGIVNRRSLAQYFIETFKLPKKEAAIQSAIRRYSPPAAEKRLSRAFKTISEAKFSTKTGLVIAAFHKNPEIQRVIPKVYQLIDYNKGEVLLIIQGEESIKMIIDSKNLNQLLKLVPETPISITRNLAELSIRVGPDSAKVPGVLSLLDSALFQNEINIVETFSCVPELIWLFDEMEIMKAYTALFELAQQASSYS